MLQVSKVDAMVVRNPKEAENARRPAGKTPTDRTRSYVEGKGTG